MSLKLVGVSALFLALVGCGPSLQELNYNNGLAQTLHFSGVDEAFALNLATPLTISHQNAGTFECYAAAAWGPGGGGGCTFLGKEVKLASIVEASCDEGTCSTRVLDNNHLEVTGLVKGSGVLRIKARLADGTTVDDSVLLRFDDVDFTVHCNEGCPGEDAIFAGEKLQLSAWASAGNRRLRRKVELEVQGPANATLKPDPDSFYDRQQAAAYNRPPVLTASIQTLGAGIATLRLSVGPYQTTRLLRVAAISEAVSGHVWTLADQAEDHSVWRASGPSLAGTQISQTMALVSGSRLIQAQRVVIGWKLNPGSVSGATRAFGGVGKISHNQPKAIIAGEHLMIMYLEPYSVPAGEKVALTGALGAAKLDETFSIKFE